ncbi:uncharacterized protein LOC118325368 [Morone saxatilis]|uniref:uncharacterized protein LOC118325368 n=1 Tax=Morone saxatilis TaxID=34816 RepID=UPI0015E21428|nr:uncharacterized protein LOC118325368 [Morone saxatilis]
MKYRAGSFKVVWVWMVILIQSLDAAHAPKTAGFSCKPKEQTALTKSLVKDCLTSFDAANGKHLGTWSPGFPELEVNETSTLNWSKVQCSLSFMAQGLEEVLEDQVKHLNTEDVSLHKKLRDTITRVRSLTVCVKKIFGGECSPKPPPPKMPRHAFDRKQWSHTLLKTAGDYLDWLKSKLGEQLLKVKGQNKIKPTATGATRQMYLEGSGYLL